MLGRVKTLRRHLAQELGFLIPPVHISDNLRLKAREYVVSLRGMEIGRWQTEGNCLLAVSTGPSRVRCRAGDPGAGLRSAGALDPALARGRGAGGRLLGRRSGNGDRNPSGGADPPACQELLGRAETKRLLDSLAESHPKLVEELVPKLLSLGEVQRVLQQLLRERVSIRDLGTILEALVEAGAEPGFATAGRGSAPGAGPEADPATAGNRRDAARDRSGACPGGRADGPGSPPESARLLARRRQARLFCAGSSTL